MRIRSFQSESRSNTFTSQLNKVFLSQSSSTSGQRGYKDRNSNNNNNNDKSLSDYSSQMYKSIAKSPKNFYKSIEKCDPIGFTNSIIDKLYDCCTFSTWQPIIPLIFAIFVVLSIIWILALVTSSRSSSSLSLNSNHGPLNNKINKIDTIENQLYTLEIDETVEKLIEIRKSGKMIEFEETLSLIIPKYCLSKISKPLDIKAEESFHLNVAETIKFIANGGAFLKHETLKLAPNGGIVDPNIKDELHSYKEYEFQSCPLLDEIFRISKLNGNSSATNGARGTNSKINDKIDQFDKSYNFDSVEYFVDYTIKLMQGECGELRDRLLIEDQKNLVLNFFNTIKQRSGNPNMDVSSSYQIYVIGNDGSIYESKKDYDKDVYYRCIPIEVVLNTNVIIEPEMTITNLRIALDKEYE